MDHAEREVRKLAFTLDLSQLVNSATRVPDVDSRTANCLDLLLTSDPDSYSVTVSAPLGTSDHCLMILYLCIRHLKNPPVKGVIATPVPGQ